MLSTILLSTPSPEAARPETVVRTLAPLVQASVRGFLRDVTLAGPPGQELSVIAEHAGCAVVEESEATRLRSALGLARAEDVLIFELGHVPEPGFFEEIEDLLGHGLPQSGLVLRRAPQGFAQRLLPQLAPKVGLLAPLAASAAAARDSLPGLIRALSPRGTLKAKLRQLG